MSNLHSRSVLKGLVVSLVSCVNLGATVTDTEYGENQFDLLELGNVIAAGVGAGLSLTALPHIRSRGLLCGMIQRFGCPRCPQCVAWRRRHNTEE